MAFPRRRSRRFLVKIRGISELVERRRKCVPRDNNRGDNNELARSPFTFTPFGFSCQRGMKLLPLRVIESKNDLENSALCRARRGSGKMERYARSFKYQLTRGNPLIREITPRVRLLRGEEGVSMAARRSVTTLSF